MKKHGVFSSIIVTFLFLLVFGLSAPSAFSQVLIIDETEVFTPEEKQFLEEKARMLHALHRVHVATLLTKLGPYTDQTLSQYAEEQYFQHGLDSNGLILAVDIERNQMEFLAFGKVSGISDVQVKKIFEAYDRPTTYFEGVEAYLNVAEQFLFTDQQKSQGQTVERYIDDVGVLNGDQSREIIRRLNEVSERYKFDVVITVIHDLPYTPAHLYAADYFETLGFGYDNSSDGAILLLAMQDRDIGFAALGSGLSAFTDKGQDYLDKLFLPDLKKNQFYEGLLAYVDAIDDFLLMAELGTPYDRGNIPLLAEERQRLQRLAIGASLLVGLLAAFGVAQVQKGKLRSKHEEHLAHQYIRPGSLTLENKRDIFMYRNLVKVVKSEGSSSGSKSFSTSSGKSATGHSKKF